MRDIMVCMSGVIRALRVTGYVVLAFVAFTLSFFVGKKTPDSGTSFLHSPYTYADAPYAEGGYYSGCGYSGDGGGDGGGSGSGGSSDAGGGADGSGCGSSGGY
jgi:hypothetical protein